LLAQHLVVRVEVAQVVRRHRAQLVEQAPRQLEVDRNLVTVGGEQLRQHVTAVEQHAPDPGQMVQADLVDDELRRLDPEPLRPAPLEPDRHVAEPDRPVPVIEQSPRDDSDRVREVDDPRIRRRAHALGDLEHDRDGAQRLREPAGSRRFLADAAARQRERLVGESSLLAADPDLDQHEVRIRDGPHRGRR